MDALLKPTANLSKAYMSQECRGTSINIYKRDREKEGKNTRACRKQKTDTMQVPGCVAVTWADQILTWSSPSAPNSGYMLVIMIKLGISQVFQDLEW